MKILIIEDEKAAAEHIKDLLHKSISGVEILAVIDSVKKAVEWFETRQDAELVLMDIQLADDISFSIFERTTVNAPVIFTTAFDEYAVRAFKLNSIDYLLKPIDARELNHAIGKFRSMRQYSLDEISKLLQWRKTAEYQKRFMVTAGSKIRSLGTDELAYCRSEGRYVKMISTDGIGYVTDHTMEKLEQLLDPGQFFRVNRQYIIALPAIRQMHAYSKGRIKIELSPAAPDEVIVSIDRSGDFKKWLDR